MRQTGAYRKVCDNSTHSPAVLCMPAYSFLYWHAFCLHVIATAVIWCFGISCVDCLQMSTPLDSRHSLCVIGPVKQHTSCAFCIDTALIFVALQGLCPVYWKGPSCFVSTMESPKNSQSTAFKFMPEHPGELSCIYRATELAAWGMVLTSIDQQ